VTAHGLSQEQAASVWSALAFSEILTVVRFMNAAGGEVTSAAVAAQAQQFTGPLLMGAPSLRCGRYADAPAVCNDQTRFYRYRGNGRFESLTGWLRPPT
jgi:branched-chain amino acid transport system substrate-binding protein